MTLRLEFDIDREWLEDVTDNEEEMTLQAFIAALREAAHEYIDFNYIESGTILDEKGDVVYSEDEGVDWNSGYLEATE